MTRAIALEPGAAHLLETLHTAGYAAYAVGGCVRDSLLGLVPHDWDLCTSATPGQVTALFGADACIPTGIRHGTVTVKFRGRLYETTTFRTEGAYSDGRHPDSVSFVPDVREDLARRDFTINAMAYDPAEGLIDPFDGQNDLERGVVRAVGDAQQRFLEDALRILRLYRFAARFGFEVDAATDEAARALCGQLDHVSIERIEDELCRLLMAPKPGRWMEPEIFNAVLPELEITKCPGEFERARMWVDALPAGEEGLCTRLAALLGNLGEEGARRALRRLNCSNARCSGTAVLVREQTLCPADSDAARRVQARRLLGRLSPEEVHRLTLLCAVRTPAQAASCRALWREAADVLAKGECCRVGQLALNGHDLMAAGVAPGPGLRRALDALLEQVVTDRVPNEREALLAELDKIEGLR